MGDSNAPIDGEVEAGVKQMVGSLPNWTFGCGMAARFAAHVQARAEHVRASIWPPWL